MLNATKLSELLAKNVDPRLYPRMFVMSPNGTLMAYSTPVDIKDLRDQAALISMAWRDHEKQIVSKPADLDLDNSSSPPSLETLTIEFQQNNIIVRAIQPQLLLVLIGGVPPYRKSIFKVTPEVRGASRYPPADVTDAESVPTTRSAEGGPSADNLLSVDNFDNGHCDKKKPASIASTMSQREKDVKSGVLHIQRRKIDALTDYIRADFEAKGFVMPEDSSFP